MAQKFFKGDLVRIGEMPQSMRHFPGNCEAVVLYTYKEKYGGGKREAQEYGVHILLPHEGETAWYHEEQLTFIARDRFDKLPKSSAHRQAWDAKQKRDNQGESK